MKLRFWKMSGAGNDFVLLDGLPHGQSGPSLARRLCDRHLSVGADGLLVVTGRGAGARIGYWNVDGSAAFCGNGTRCAAVWMSERRRVKGRSFTVATNRGRLQIRLTGKSRAEVQMPSPFDFVAGKRIKTAALNKKISTHFVNTGVPHAVVFVPDVAKTNVKELGRELRFHKAYGKAGANVDFVQLKDSVVLLRTYERGVEDETLACGTGVVAAAFVARALGKAGSPVAVKVRSGETLYVSFNDGARLEGPTEVVYTGEVSL